MRRFYYFNATHWDREWYQSFQEFRKYLLDTTGKLLEIFDGVDNYRRFTFDGQTIVLEDIVEVHPEWRKKLEVLISSGRLAVGPWYVMPDEFLVSGEALIRNLQTGTRVAREFGHEPWPVGYVCDIFGHIAQLPQIFAGFGLKGAVCWRGTPDLGFEHLLYWESPDGTRLATINLGKHHGYADFTLGLRRGRREPYEEASFKADFRKYLEDNLNRWGEVVVLSDALDHAPPTASTPDMLRWIGELYPEAEVIHSDYADLFEREFPGNYPVIRGEQIEPADSEYHVGYQISATLSSRGDVKLANDLAQNELELLLEPQLAARAAAGDVSSLPLLRYQWKKLLANHAHDSICGCSIDAVHRAVLCRCEEVRALGRMLNEEFVLQDEAARTLPGEEPLQPHVFPAAADGVYTLSIYNPLPWEVNSAREIELRFPTDKPYPAVQAEPFGYEHFNSFRIFDADGAEVRYQLLSIRRNRTRSLYRQAAARYDFYTVIAAPRLRASGWTRLELRPSAVPVRCFESMLLSPHAAANRLVRVDVNADGTFDLSCLRTGRRYAGLNDFVFDREIGDGWNHVTPVGTPVVTGGAAVRIAVTADGPERVEFEIVRRYELPEEILFAGTIGETYAGITESPHRRALDITTRISLDRDRDTVGLKIEIDNHIRDYRLRLRLPTGIAGEYFAGQAFAMLHRPEGRKSGNASESYRETETIEKNFDGVIGRRDAQGGIAFLCRGGIHEAGGWMDEAHSLGITLLRAFRRTVMTEGESDGQMPGPRCFEGAVCCFDAGVAETGLFRRLQEVRAAFPAELAPRSALQRVVRDDSLVTLEGEVAFSALKPCDDGRSGAVVLRFFNPGRLAASARIRTGARLAGAVRCRVDETEVEALKLEDEHTVVTTAAPGWIVTIRLDFSK